MTRLLFKFMTIALLLLGCEKDNLIIDPNYPSTFYKIPTEILSQMRNSLSSNNQYLTSTLNDFGFCYLPEDHINTEPPSIPNVLTETQSIEIAKNFIKSHPSETGIQNPEALTISRSYFWPGGINWFVVSAFQKIDTLEVMYTELVIKIKNGALISCEGNWYPNLYIPSKFNISEDKAKKDLVGKVVTHYSVGGEKYSVKISKTDVEGSTIDLIIVPIKYVDKIELRVAWVINIPGPIFCKIYVDVMLGDIIKQDPTIIS